MSTDESGSNHTQRGPLDPANEISRVPLLHGASSEHEELAWRFFVDHYQRDKSGRLPDGIAEDPKRDAKNKIFYPRASGIGGCTIHNLACYELIRRRAPRMIACDGGADPSFGSTIHIRPVAQSCCI